MSQVQEWTGQLLRTERAFSGPTSANIEVTSFCNIDCIMCRRTSWGKGRSVGNMSLENFERVLTDIPTLRAATLTGIGEPLINKQFLAMLRLSHERELATTFVTNGTIVERQGEEAILEMRRLASQIIVSLDSPDRDEFEAIRVRANYDDVIGGIRAFTRSGGGEAGLAPIRVNTVVMEGTVARMIQTVELCSELGVDIVTFTPIMEYRPDVGLWDQHHIANTDAFREQQQAAIELGRERGVRVTTETVSHPKLAPVIGCAAPWSSIAITFDGHVCPCCMLNDSDEIHFGNMFDTPFAEIWNGGPYREFRKKFGLRRVPKECQDVQCQVAMGILGAHI